MMFKVLIPMPWLLVQVEAVDPLLRPVDLDHLQQVVPRGQVAVLVEVLIQMQQVDLVK